MQLGDQVAFFGVRPALNFLIKQNWQLADRTWRSSCVPSPGTRSTRATAGPSSRPTARRTSSCRAGRRRPMTSRGTPGRSPGPSFTGAQIKASFTDLETLYQLSVSFVQKIVSHPPLPSGDCTHRVGKNRSKIHLINLTNIGKCPRQGTLLYWNFMSVFLQATEN